LKANVLKVAVKRFSNMFLFTCLAQTRSISHYCI